jgi:hypothetical protein
MGFAGVGTLPAFTKMSKAILIGAGMKHRVLPFLGLLFGLIPLIGCATIMKGSDQKVAFQSSPSGAKVSVYDSSGMLVGDGTTPITLPLKKGASYFQAAKYRVVFEATGHQKKEIWLTGSLEGGWYIVGNFFIGGLIGWLIVDPLTGAMWTLSPDTVNATLDPGMSKIDGGLRVILAEQVSPKMLAMATPINSKTD